MDSQILLAIILLPLMGSFITGTLSFFERTEESPKAKSLRSGLIASMAIGLAFVISLYQFYLLSQTQFVSGPVFLKWNLGEWLAFGPLKFSIGLRLDHINSVMCLIITGVGFLIHLFSIGYMDHDRSASRYFSHLNLFCTAMLILVLGDSFPLIFLGWEGVGVCSYLLIGFWYQEKEKQAAALKAFILNRIGDVGFLIGMFLLYKETGSLEWGNLSGQSLSQSSAFWIGLAFFVACTGKSAQIPLFVWLPDAMSGPTPVSALIHAATMVTAGIYLLLRLQGILLLSPDLMMIIAWVAAVTSLMSATIAVTQNDIKKILAYSTVSQLGFMFVAIGVGAFSTALFHVTTHAFFKALLFLGAGSVIHACHGEQNVLKMGGLKKYLPHTYLTMLVGSLALAGIPLTSGFFSKDEILHSIIALPYGGLSLYLVMTVTAGLTAIYSVRLITLTFLGNYRGPTDAQNLPHESGPWMTIPLYVLAGLALFGGWMGAPHIFHLHHTFNAWIGQSLQILELPELGVHWNVSELIPMLISSIIAVSFFWFFAVVFRKFTQLDQWWKGSKVFIQLASSKYLVDEIYHLIIVRPIYMASKFLARVLDRDVIDRSVDASGGLVSKVGGRLRILHSGDLQDYGAMIVILLGLIASTFFL
ncbi:MAG: NADH-quinone oxidoreductase subunit L [Bacteriovoracaceae bacterium]|nr:NADH-quinone oxidoreductase subunit L [Bacteriovoracaceae bacterium]